MAIELSPLQNCGSFNTGQKQALFKVFRSIDDVATLDVPQASTAALTAASGTASDTIADVTATPTQTICNNNFKSLAVKINDLRTELIAAGVLS